MEKSKVVFGITTIIILLIIVFLTGYIILKTSNNLEKNNPIDKIKSSQINPNKSPEIIYKDFLDEINQTNTPEEYDLLLDKYYTKEYAKQKKFTPNDDKLHWISLLKERYNGLFMDLSLDNMDHTDALVTANYYTVEDVEFVGPVPYNYRHTVSFKQENNQWKISELYFAKKQSLPPFPKEEQQEWWESQITS